MGIGVGVLVRYPRSVVLKVWFQPPPAAAAPGNLLEMQILGNLARPMETPKGV